MTTTSVYHFLFTVLQKFEKYGIRSKRKRERISLHYEFVGS